MFIIAAFVTTICIGDGYVAIVLDKRFTSENRVGIGKRVIEFLTCALISAERMLPRTASAFGDSFVGDDDSADDD